MNVARAFAVITLVSLIAGPNLSPQSTTGSSFDVVSIRQVKASSERSGERSYVETTANGWRLNDGPLFAAIINAYTPSSGNGNFYTLRQVQGLPDWAKEERYVIDAKIAESDMTKWHDLHVQADLQRAMMRSMLAERCKLRVHRELKEVQVYLLLLDKEGPKFKAAVPDTPHPSADPLPGGGEFRSTDANGVMHFYGAPISAVAGVLSNIMGRPVQDATGLTGRYDVPLKMPTTDSPTQVNSDIDSSVSISSAVADLGLKLVPARGKIETLVIDQIERPSEN